MKRLPFLAILLALICVYLPVLVRADAANATRQAIQSRYDRFDRAYMKKDFKSAAQVFTPECVLKLNSEGRTMTAVRVVQGMEAVSKSLTISQAKTRILSVKPIKYGYEVAAVWSGNSAYIPANGSKEDPPRRSRAKQTVLDTWKKTDTGWQIAHRVIEEADDDTPPKTQK